MFLLLSAFGVAWKHPDLDSQVADLVFIHRMYHPHFRTHAE